MPTLEELTADQANFDHYLGAIQALEEREDFGEADSGLAINTLSRIYYAFLPYRDSGDINDDDWKRIEQLTADRATAYREAKSSDGRFAVLDEAVLSGDVPLSDNPDKLESWFDREISRISKTRGAPLYVEDLRYVRDEMVGEARWRARAPWILGAGGATVVGVASWFLLRRFKIDKQRALNRAKENNIRDLLKEYCDALVGVEKFHSFDEEQKIHLGDEELSSLKRRIHESTPEEFGGIKKSLDDVLSAFLPAIKADLDSGGASERMAEKTLQDLRCAENKVSRMM